MNEQTNNNNNNNKKNTCSRKEHNNKKLGISKNYLDNLATSGYKLNQDSKLKMQLPLSDMFYNQTLTLVIQSCPQYRQTRGILESMEFWKL